MSDVLYSNEMVYWYDKLYMGDVRKVVRFINSILMNYECKSVLDVGCGTGGHAFELKKMNYGVVGVDVSKDMIDYAIKKSSSLGIKIPFYIQDMRKLNLGRKFDAAICIFSPFMYMVTNEDAISALKSINQHLKKGGIVLIDVGPLWYKIYTGEFRTVHVDHFSKGDLRMEAHHKSRLIPELEVVEEKTIYHRYIGKKKLPVVEDEKANRLRLFSPNDFDLLFRLTGFRTLKFFRDFSTGKKEPKKWKRLIALAQKI